jgi:rhodanese-related sulfurtransferase
MSYTTISPQQLHELRSSGKAVDLIDVRSPSEYAEVHAVDAANVPLETVSPDSVQAARKNGNDQPVYVICRSGGRSRSACEQLVATGMKNIVNVEGGTLAWEKAGLPVIRGNTPIWRRLARPVGIPLMLLFLILAVTVKVYFLIGMVAVWAAMVSLGGCPLYAMLFKSSCKCGCPVSR